MQSIQGLDSVDQNKKFKLQDSLGYGLFTQLKRVGINRCKAFKKMGDKAKKKFEMEKSFIKNKITP